jgi:hypothetical protein
VTRDASEWIPLWLNEGLAELYQNTDIQVKEVLLGEANTDDISYLRQNRLLPVITLLKVDQTSPYYHEEQKGSVFYAESWALTHYIEISDAQKKTNRLQRGTLRGVHCGYPTVLTFRVDPATNGKPVSLYRNDFNQIEFTAANFAPKNDLNPCTDIEGLKAKVQFAEVSDKSVAGQIISVELSK